MDDNDEAEEEFNEQLIRAFGPTVTSNIQGEIQEVTQTQGLSPRGRKIQISSNKQATTNLSSNSSRPNTRSKSRRF